MQPFKMIVQPQVTIDAHVFDREDLGHCCNLQHPQEQIFLSSFAGFRLPLSRYVYVVAITDELPGLYELSKWLEYQELMNDCVLHHMLISFTLQDAMTFLTTHRANLPDTFQVFANWLYLKLNEKLPELFKNYTKKTSNTSKLFYLELRK